MKKMLFVFNPNSGRGMIKRKLFEVVDIFAKEYHVWLYPTQAAMDGYYYILNTEENFDVVVCSGGDGTLNEVIKALRRKGTDIPVGYIPSGSTNDFGASVGIPKVITHAARQIMDGEPYYCDMGQFNDNTFNYVAAFGAFTDVSYATSQDLKNIIGHSAYLLEGVNRLFSLKSYDLTLECNEKKIRGEFIYGMVSNSKVVGGMKGIMGKNVKMNDGLFEVTFIRKPKDPLLLEQVIGGVLFQNICERKEICISEKASHIKVTCDSAIPWTLDGEYGGGCKRVDIQVIHNAFRLLCTKPIL